jgi:DNA mismatch repair protein MutS
MTSAARSCPDTPDSGGRPEAETPAETGGPVSPMMAQYLAIKRDHPDALLFYRMGDFYELFFEDAETAAAAVDIVLTKRGRHQGTDIPMCGVPVHSYESYLQRLIRQGHKVAICEQVEDPAEARKRGSKSVVRREVTRVVTSGTLVEDSLLDRRVHNFLLAVARAGDRLAAAWTDVSTGALASAACGSATDGAIALAALLSRVDPSEILVADRLLDSPLGATLEDWRDRLTVLPAPRFDSGGAERRLKERFAVATLDAFGAFDRAELAALGAVVEYVELTQRGTLPILRPPVGQRSGATMLIDAATRRNLELGRTLSGERNGSLLATVDRTITGGGARLLAERLSAPLTDPETIDARLDEVAFFGDVECRRGIRDLLRHAPDIERALSRLAVGRGGPRDLAAVRGGLQSGAAISARLEAGVTAPPPGVTEAAAALTGHAGLVGRLERALREDLPAALRDGNFIAAGFDPALDELRELRDESRRHIAAMQARYADETGVASLKIRHNNVLGYYVEVTSLHAEKLRGEEGGRFVHRQSMANAMRFTTTELGELESRLSSAAERALALEMEIFEALRRAVLDAADAVVAAAAAIARIDVAAGLAELAAACRYVRPKVDRSTDFNVVGGRHPVVEAALAARASGGFVANDCDLAETQRLWLLTGPNMAGKSTFLRQNALIAVLAQAGSFVPAESATLGVVDQLFSRVGAADDLARGRSTFMVEMVETAAILNQAGPRALVILDEIGRGTATFDGLSIAWAVVEHLHEVNRCRALFATHYHELTALSARLPALANRTMRVKEWRGDVVFLHEVAVGAADRSYGVQVARLAGLPPSVVDRASAVLAALESGEQAGAAARLADDLPLFSAEVARRAAPSPARSRVEDTLADVHPDDLSAREALDLVYRLVELLQADTDRP